MIYYLSAGWGLLLSAVLIAVWLVKRKRGVLSADQLYVMPALAGLFTTVAIAQLLKLIARTTSATIMGCALLAFLVFSIWQLKRLRRQSP